MLNTPKYSGEPTPQALASGLATLGRYGDEFMVHAAEGETVIPPEIFEANPQLKADLFRQMAMMGIKDPNRYVVGNSLNSINPLTGQPEFFFKKIFKSIKKVFKKALPIIAPIIGNLIAPGIGGIIASGLVTKMQGGSWGDVLKGAAIGWATQGLTGGISGAMSAAPGQGFSGFTSGLTQGLSAPFTAASNLFSSGPANPFSQGIFGSSKALAGAGIFGKTLSPQYNPTAGTSGITAAGQQVGAVTSAAGQPVGAPVSAAGQPVGAVTSAPALADGMTASGDFSGSLSDIGGTDLSPGYDAVKLQTFRPPPAQINPQVSAASGDAFNIENSDFGAAGSIPETVPTVSTEQDLLASFDANTDDPSYGFEPDTDPPGFAARTAEQLKTYFDPTEEAAGLKRVERLKDFQKKIVADRVLSHPTEPLTSTQISTESAKWLKDNPVPGLLSRSAPLIAATGIAGVGLAAAAGAFSEEEEEFNANPNKSDKEIEAYEKWGQIPDKNSLEAQKQFGIWNMKPYVTRSQFEAQTGGRSARPDWRFLPESNVMGVAMGGEVVGPGTGTSDSIPARLSDGEFVMTANAVQNAGGGNRDLGAARMYDMMRRFEGGVA
jgi:hypothetical protein